MLLLPQNVSLAFKVLAACIILQQIQDNLISPLIMQNSVNVNPVGIFFALLVGAKIAEFELSTEFGGVDLIELVETYPNYDRPYCSN